MAAEDLVINARLIDQMSRELRQIRRELDKTRNSTDDNKKSMKDWDRQNKIWARGLRRLQAETAAFNKLLKALKIPAILTGVRLLASALKALSASVIQASQSFVSLFGVLGSLPSVIVALLTTMAVFKLAFKGIGDAVAALTEKDPQAIAEAFKNLTPDAQRVALTIADIGTNFTTLGREAGGRVLPLIKDGLQRILERVLPETNKGILEMADGLGRVGDRGLKLVSSDGFVADIGGMMHTNAVITERFGDGLVALVDAFRHIAVAAAPFTTWFGDLIARGAEWFATQMAISRGNGALDSYFARTRRTIENLVKLTQDFFVGFRNVLEVGRENQGGFIDRMVAATERFREWTESLRGRNAIAEYFRHGNEVLDRLIEAGRQIWDILFGSDAKVGDSQLIATLDRIIAPDGLLAAFKNLSDGVAQGLGPAIIDMITSFVRFTNVMPFNPIIELAKLIANVTTKIFDFFEANPKIGEFAANITASLLGMSLFLGVVGRIAGAFAPAFRAISKFWKFFMKLSGAGRLLLTGPLAAVLLIAGAIKLMWDNSEKFRDAMGDLGRAVSEVFTEIFGGMGGGDGNAFETLGETFGRFGDTVAGWVPRIIEFIRKIPGALRAAADFARPILQRLGVFFTDLWNNVIRPFAVWTGTVFVPMLTNAISAVWSVVAPIVQAWIRVILRLAKMWIDHVWPGVVAIIERAGPIIGRIIRLVVDAINGTADRLRTFSELWASGWEAVKSAMTRIGANIRDAIQRLRDKIAAVRSSWNDAWNRMGDRIQAAKDRIVGILDTLKNAAQRTIDTLREAVTFGRADTQTYNGGGGDTRTPKRRGAGALGSTLANHANINAGLPGKRTITNALYGAYAGSDHRAGAALDLQGSNLQGYAKRLRDQGGFAEFHGNGRERHLHAVHGDTARPRRQMAMAGPTSDTGGGGGGGDMHLHFPNAVDQASILAAVNQALQRRERDRRER